MFSVYRILSLRYLQRRWFRAVLIMASISLGVATLVATIALNITMSKGAVASANPMAGLADFLVSNGDATVAGSLVQDLKIDGVKSVQARVFHNAYLPRFDKPVLVMGIDLKNSANDLRDQSEKDTIRFGEQTTANYLAAVVAQRFVGVCPAVVGKALADDVEENSGFFSKFVLELKKNALDPKEEPQKVVPIPFIDGTGVFSFLGGYVMLLDLKDAATIFGTKEDQVHRIDIALESTADHGKVRAELEKILRGRASLKTPEEQNESLQSVMTGMQTGLTFCGIVALVIGFFLMYSALSVMVAERRHEIGILRSVGATRSQVCRLLAGEAAIIGLIGSMIGLPFGWGLAKLGLGPVREVTQEIFTKIEAQGVELPIAIMLGAILSGTLVATLAGLLPAMQATRENPAEAVRRVTKGVSFRQLIGQVSASIGLIVVGVLMALLRGWIGRVGTYGGLVCVLLGALVAAPFIAALLARMIQPFARWFLPIEWRMAADNLVRSPGRTGLVIGALAAGVALVMQTTGTIHSNRKGFRDWVDDTFSADLIVTAGGPVSVGQGMLMSESVGNEIRKLKDIEAALPMRALKIPFRDTNIYVCSIEANSVAAMDAKRKIKGDSVRLARILHERPNSVIVSENFAILYGIKNGDIVTLQSREGPVQLEVIGQLVDYFWPHGTLIMDRQQFKKYWADDKVTSYDVYLSNGGGHREQIQSTKDLINKQLGAHQLHAVTCGELASQIDDTIERAHAIAYVQQIIVAVVSVLGVVMALLISILQRRRELGLLRAIGASRAQIIRSVLAEACLMGVIGTIIGLLVGVPLQWYVLRVVFLEESGYLFPVYVPWLGALIIAGAAMLVATLAGLGPAVHSVRMRIPEAIAYE